MGPRTSNSTDSGADDFPLAGPVVPEGLTDVACAEISVRLQLVPTREIRPTSLLQISANERDAFETLLRSAGDRLVPQLRIARIGTGVTAANLIRPASRRNKLPSAAWPGTAFASHPAFPNLFLPIGFTLRPNLRTARLTELLALSPDRLTWMSTTDTGLRIASVPLASFHKPTLSLSFARRVALVPIRSTPDPFHLLPMQVAAVVPHVPVQDEDSPAAKSGRPPVKVREGWLGRLVKSLRKTRATAPAPSAELPSRVDGLLATTDSLTSGSFVSSHRAELEQRVLSQLPSADETVRANLWAELAETYSIGRRSADAALCWWNAIWDEPSPPAAWFDGLVRDETFAARRPLGEHHWNAWLAEPASIPTIRLAAAHLIHAASGFSTEWGFRSHLPALIQAIDSVESDLPVRLVWLTRLAASAFAAGDALALARSRDAIFKRLSGSGPALDRDAPAFLRFAGHAHGHREARDWVLRVREPARRWVRRVAGGGRLQRFGLDGEAHATAAYVDYLFAWAAGRHGERAAAAEWEAAATATLQKIGGPVHPLLVAAFKQRIREARDGHMAGPSSLQKLDALDEFDRFTVRKFQSLSTILEPYIRRDAYHGHSASDHEAPFPDTMRAAEAWIESLSRRLRDPLLGERALATLIETALAVSARFDNPIPVTLVVEHLTGNEAPPLAAFGALLDRVGISLFKAMRQSSVDASELVMRLAPPHGSPGDVRSAVAAAGWLAAGREEQGLERLDACRDRLYAENVDPRERTSLAIATAQALGLAPPRVALGRLEELFTRLDRIDVTGSTNRFVTLKLFQIVEAAVRSAVGGEALPTPAVKAWLAADERIILRRIAREANAGIA